MEKSCIFTALDLAASVTQIVRLELQGELSFPQLTTTMKLHKTAEEPRVFHPRKLNLFCVTLNITALQ